MYEVECFNIMLNFEITQETTMKKLHYGNNLDIFPYHTEMFTKHSSKQTNKQNKKVTE